MGISHIKTDEYLQKNFFMNRRNFLQRTGALSVALAGLPLAKKKKKQVSPDNYRSSLALDKPNQVVYYIDIYNKAVSGFATATDAEKKIRLAGYFYEKADQIVYSKKFDYSFTMKSAAKDPKDADSWIIKTANAKKEEGELAWPKDLPANPDIKISLFATATLINKSGKEFVNMPRQAQTDDNDDDMGCFITTACVTERGLADNCNELETLRSLRENYMRHTEQGKQLLKEYLLLGPAVVASIGECENRPAIYDYLYQNMILPAVDMIKNGDHQQAVDWYEGFSRQLKKNYC
jgi:hypothetical protein